MKKINEAINATQPNTVDTTNNNDKRIINSSEQNIKNLLNIISYLFFLLLFIPKIIYTGYKLRHSDPQQILREHEEKKAELNKAQSVLNEEKQNFEKIVESKVEQKYKALLKEKTDEVSKLNLEIQSLKENISKNTALKNQLEKNIKLLEEQQEQQKKCLPSSIIEKALDMTKISLHTQAQVFNSHNETIQKIHAQSNAAQTHIVEKMSYTIDKLAENANHTTNNYHKEYKQVFFKGRALSQRQDDEHHKKYLAYSNTPSDGSEEENDGENTRPSFSYE